MFKRPQFDRRAAGILLHLTSLPGPDGSGDLGPQAHRFVDFLADAGQRWWQMLPVVPPGPAPGFSPYSAQSAFAGSPWLVSIEQLFRDGLLSRRRSNSRTSLLRQSHIEFKRRAPQRAGFEAFCHSEKNWLEDWCLFAALKDAHPGKQWCDWEHGIRTRDPLALRAARTALAEELDFHRFVQFQFDRQWRSLKKHCQEKRIGLLGDVPIFVAADSADVWANQELFTLRADGTPSRISGCPPDVFSKTGQIWRHPHYRWSAHRKTKFRWWVSRFASELSRFDGVRVDHFLGFYRTWAIPGDAKDGRTGSWMLTPGRELFAEVRKKVGGAPIIAEDLGLLIPPAAKLRDDLGLPGMRVLQFGFGDNSYHLPHDFIPHCIAYTGTHDNDTFVGWFTKASKPEQKKAIAYANSSPRSIHRDMIRALMASVAQTAIVPMQDVLGLGTEARMNLPGTERGNWAWRMKASDLTPALARELRQTATLYDRA